jgi:hypothetical protein
MDLENLTDEQYFAAMKMMFNTDGWIILIQELTDSAALINDVQDIHTLENLHFIKGQLSTLGRILMFQETLKRAEAEAAEAAEEE